MAVAVDDLDGIPTGTSLDLFDDPRVAGELLDAAPFLISVIELEGEDFRYVSVNPAAATYLGLHREELIGRKAGGLGLPADRLAQYFDHCRESVRGGEPVHFDDPHRTPMGLRWVSITVCPLTGPAGGLPRFCVLGVDQTERRKAERRVFELNAKLEQQAERTKALREIDRAITSTHDLAMTLDVILRQTCGELEVDAAAVLLCSSDHPGLEYAAFRGYRGDPTARPALRYDQSPAGRAVLERRTQSRRSGQSRDGVDPGEPLRSERFARYWAVPMIAKGWVRGVLEVGLRGESDAEPDPGWLDFLECLASQAAIAVDNATMFDGLRRSNLDLSLAYDATIEGWSRAMDLRDHETEGHSQRVTEMTLRLARALGLAGDEMIHIRRGSLLHDIGKMGIPDGILSKPGPLTDDEWVVMKKHPQYAYDMLAPIPFLRQAIEIPYGHHEKWDGTGCPRGLKAEQIPMSARIFAAVDIWDALSYDRPYRRAWPSRRVRDHIASLSGTHLDRVVVNAFLPILDAATDE